MNARRNIVRRLTAVLSLGLLLLAATPAIAQQPTVGALQAQIEIMNVTRQQTEASLGAALDGLRTRLTAQDSEIATLKAALAKATADKKPEPEKPK